MRPGFWNEYERFALGDKRATVSDLQRAKYLRKEIASSLARLDYLRSDPKRNAQQIMEEEGIIRLTNRELSQLESRFFMA